MEHTYPPLEIFSLDNMPYAKLDAYTDRHKQVHFEIIWIEYGEGYHIVDDMRYPLVPGAVYCAVPGQDHTLSIEEGTRGYMLLFSEDILEQEFGEYDVLYGASLRRLMGRSSEIKVDSSAGEDISDLLTLMLKEVRKYALQRKGIFIKYLKILLMLVREQMNTSSALPQQGARAVMVDGFFSLLEEHFKTERTVTWYADRLFVSPNYFNSVIKLFTGYSARHHIQQRVIQEAKRAAYHRTSSLKEIAYHLGFADSSHFSKFFKNVSGVNFSSFRKKELIIC